MDTRKGVLVMNKYEELQQKFNALQEEFDMLKAEEEKLWPQDGDNCWCAEGDGDVYPYDYDSEWSWHADALAMGLLFQTSEEAEQKIAKMKMEKALRDFFREREDEPVDWGNLRQEKYMIVYDHRAEQFYSRYAQECQTAGVIYTSSKEAVENAIEHFGDRLHVLFYDI